MGRGALKDLLLLIGCVSLRRRRTVSSACAPRCASCMRAMSSGRSPFGRPLQKKKKRKKKSGGGGVSFHGGRSPIFAMIRSGWRSWPMPINGKSGGRPRNTKVRLLFQSARTSPKRDVVFELSDRKFFFHSGLRKKDTI